MFNRAKDHISEFERKVNAYIGSKPGTYTVETDIDRVHKLHKIKLTRPPEVLANIVFDAANNLRATLDQAGYAAAVAAKSSFLKATKFPFAPDAGHFANNLAGGCKDLPPEIRTLFGSFNSYKGGNDTLWAMNELCNTSKHLSLVPVALKRGAMSWGKIHYTSVAATGLPDIKWDPDKHEIVFDRSDPMTIVHFDIDKNFKISVAIESIDVIRDEPAVGVLLDMASIVENILMATEAECRRMGLI